MTPTVRTAPAGGLARGAVRVPGDKSLSHRALIFAALCPGEFMLRGLSHGHDVAATAGALRAAGVPIEAGVEEGPWVVGDADRGAFHEPPDVIDCGNSGTSMRLLAGLFAGSPFLTTLTGDVSLRSRPMARVVEPLRAMGASVDGRGDGRFAPLVVRGGALRGIEHASAVASAQVKSCVLLAGLRARGEVIVREPHRSRDHTERMLQAFGVALDVRADRVAMQGGQGLRPPGTTDLAVPADISAAAFFAVLAAIRPGSELTLPGVGVNPTRDGLLEALERAGVRVQLRAPRRVAGEEVADLVVTGGALRAFEIGGALVPRLIDEIPVLAVLAARCPGASIFRDASELRAKESDRIASTARMLRAFGVEVEERADGFVVHGRPDLPLDAGATVDCVHDHRIAMSAAVAATCAAGPARLLGAGAVDSSFPGFFDILERALVR